MTNTIHHISKVEIKGLWSRFDLSWDLNADVNVLSGINGSGKSTILNCIAHRIILGSQLKKLSKLIQGSTITFNNGQYIEMGTVYNLNTLDRLKISNEQITQKIKIDLISTFDKEIIDEKIAQLLDENIRTELDLDISKLQKQYLDYQLNIGKKAFNIISKNGGQYQTDVLKIRQPQERFLEIIDSLFQETGKKINRENNEITFLSGGQELTTYQLSSGEKQMLVILLTVLVQDNKPAILFMDEPEVSLHFDWQKKLIQYIRELNPNVQIILATHSPAVIMEGWRDKVFEVRDLITADNAQLTK